MKLKKINYNFLSVFIAALAIILSQFPPLHEILFYSPELEVKMEDEFFLVPNGFIGFTLEKNYTVTNIGEEAGRVRDIYLFVLNQKNEIIVEAEVKSFFNPEISTFGIAQWSDFGEIALHPGNNWSSRLSFKSLNFFYDISDIEEIAVEIESEKEYWMYDMEELGYDFSKFNPNMPSFEISERLLESLKKRVEKEISWLSFGKYRLYEVSMTGESKKIKKYNFEVRKKDLINFADSVNYFKYGVDAPHKATRFELREDTKEIPTTLLSKIKTL